MNQIRSPEMTVMISPPGTDEEVAIALQQYSAFMDLIDTYRSGLDDIFSAIDPSNDHKKHQKHLKRLKDDDALRFFLIIWKECSATTPEACALAGIQKYQNGKPFNANQLANMLVPTEPSEDTLRKYDAIRARHKDTIQAAEYAGLIIRIKIENYYPLLATQTLVNLLYNSGLIVGLSQNIDLEEK